MALAVTRPLELDLCRRRGRAPDVSGVRTGNQNPASEPSTTLGTFSFVFIYSSDPEHPKTLTGKMRPDGTYVLSNGDGRVTGVLIPLKRSELEEARKSEKEVWGSMDTLAECNSDGRMCLIKGVVPHLFKEHFILKRGVYKVE